MHQNVHRHISAASLGTDQTCRWGGIGAEHLEELFLKAGRSNRGKRSLHSGHASPGLPARLTARSHSNAWHVITGPSFPPPLQTPAARHSPGFRNAITPDAAAPPLWPGSSSGEVSHPGLRMLPTCLHGYAALTMCQICHRECLPSGLVLGGLCRWQALLSALHLGESCWERAARKSKRYHESSIADMNCWCQCEACKMKHVLVFSDVPQLWPRLRNNAAVRSITASMSSFVLLQMALVPQCDWHCSKLAWDWVCCST